MRPQRIFKQPLSAARRNALIGWVACCALPCGAHAQQIDTTAPLLSLPLPGMDARGIPVGPLTVFPSGEARIEYDSNIYAEPNDPVDDGVVTVTRRLDARWEGGPASLVMLSEARIRRYLSRTSENSEAGLVSLAGGYSPDESDNFRGGISWRRAIEDRGDPEASDVRTTGPRRLNIFGGELGWTHDGRKLHFSANGAVSKIDYLSSINSDRDLSIYSGSGSVGYDVTSGVRAVATGFFSRRNARLATDFTGIDRDADTYGVRAGLRLADTGLLQGEATIGLFRFTPDDPTLSSRTGVSVAASLAYILTRRIAFSLDGFRGDVATVRNGAQARTDTRVRLGVQAEARTNLRMQASVFYRRSDFVGVDISEKTFGISSEAEYRVNRFWSVAATILYANRDSDDPSQPFERTRAAIELRTRF